MKDLSDVIFCIGDSAAKHAALRRNVDETCALADNDEVYASLCEQDKTFFIVGSYPFGDMTVSEFIRYNRMIITRDCYKNSYIRKFIKKACGKKVSVRKRLRSLDVFMYRAVKILSAVTDKTQEIMINFDGVPYSKENEIKLFRFLYALKQKYALTVAVSDNRFIASGATVRRYEKDGNSAELSLKADSRILRGKRLVMAYTRRRGLDIPASDIKKIVVAV